MKRPAQHTAAAVADWLREGRRVVAGLLVEVEGSSPLDVGASMYVDDQGHIEGSITGGCVEGAVAAAAMEILESGGPPRLETYGISDELAGTVGLMCGGIVHIFIHEIRAEAREAVIKDLEALRGGRPRRRPAAGCQRLARGARADRRGPLEPARLRRGRRLAGQRPARVRRRARRAPADDRVRRHRLLVRARAAGQ